MHPPLIATDVGTLRQRGDDTIHAHPLCRLHCPHPFREQGKLESPELCWRFPILPCEMHLENLFRFRRLNCDNTRAEAQINSTMIKTHVHRLQHILQANTAPLLRYVFVAGSPTTFAIRELALVELEPNDCTRLLVDKLFLCV
jgi:hypothetical protein